MEILLRQRGDWFSHQQLLQVNNIFCNKILFKISNNNIFFSGFVIKFNLIGILILAGSPAERKVGKYRKALEGHSDEEEEKKEENEKPKKEEKKAATPKAAKVDPKMSKDKKPVDQPKTTGIPKIPTIISHFNLAFYVQTLNQELKKLKRRCRSTSC